MAASDPESGVNVELPEKDSGPVVICVAKELKETIGSTPGEGELLASCVGSAPGSLIRSILDATGRVGMGVPPSEDAVS